MRGLQSLVLALAGATLLAGGAGAGSYFPPPGDGQPVWSPDGSAIVYVSQRTPPGLHVIRPDGTPQGSLPDLPLSGGLAFSRDWFWIAYTAFEPSVPGGFALVVSRPDGSQRRVLGPHDGGTPAWSPDGRRLAFSRRGANEPPDLYTIAVDGAGLTKIAERASAPRFSPDGRRIAYVVEDPSRNRTDVVVANADGSGPVTLTASLAGYTYAPPSWSPDGSRLAFVRSGRIAVVRPDGTALRRYASIGSVNVVEWSPDGTRLLFADAGGVAFVDVATGRRTTVSAFGTAPSWSPDGRSVAFGGGGECKDRSGVYRVDLGRVPVRLTNPCRIHGTDGPDLVFGTELADVLLGLAGNDRLAARDGNYQGDDLYGGAGDDLLRGDFLSDLLDGGPGRDRLTGATGPDTLRGGPGRDVLDGARGRDVFLAEDGARDAVSCGTNVGGPRELDTVFADRGDAVARDCELVYRGGRLNLARGRTAFGIKVWAGSPGRIVFQRRLRCQPPGGTLPNAARACLRLATMRGALAPLPPTRVCAAAPQSFRRARVEGSVGGVAVFIDFHRNTSCELARWNRHRFLFGPAG